ncbi:MAG TPA: nuclear transport factor 2 family protein [Myxococcota bacterium]|jgi:hypothetical protein
MELWELAAREGIRDTVARYTWCGEFMDGAGFGDCFTPDAVLEIKGGATYRGRDEIVGMLGGVRERTRAVAPLASAMPAVMRHFVANLRIELESRERARCFAYFTVFVPPHGHDHWGRYADELVREAERWRFARRRVSVDGAVAASRMWPLG